MRVGVGKNHTSWELNGFFILGGKNHENTKERIHIDFGVGHGRIS